MCVPQFPQLPQLLPDVHPFDILHKRNTVNCPSGVRRERTHGYHVSVRFCFCRVNHHLMEAEVLATAVYTSCDLQDLIKSPTAVQPHEQMKNKAIKTTVCGNEPQLP